jgi:hypothetical protein
VSDDTEQLSGPSEAVSNAEFIPNAGFVAMQKAIAIRKAQGLPLGRPKGVQNKLTKLVRDGLATVYDDLGGDDAFLKWARAHKTQFYTGLMRCIPKEKEVNSLGTGVTILVDHRDESSGAKTL